MQHGEILRVFFGVREKEDLKKLNGQSDGEYKAERLLKKIAQDFKDSGIDGILSDNIKPGLIRIDRFVDCLLTLVIF